MIQAVSLNRPREFQQMAFNVSIFSEDFGWAMACKKMRLEKFENRTDKSIMNDEC